jgi:hypothetical protein
VSPNSTKNFCCEIKDTTHIIISKLLKRFKTIYNFYDYVLKSYFHEYLQEKILTLVKRDHFYIHIGEIIHVSIILNINFKFY